MQTRFCYDDARTIKALQQSTGPGRYVLEVPGPLNMTWTEDPYCRAQRWGGNLAEDVFHINNAFSGRTIPLNRGLIPSVAPTFVPAEYVQNQQVDTQVLTTEQSRASLPAFLFRDLEQNHAYYLMYDPQSWSRIAPSFSTMMNARQDAVLTYDEHLRQRGSHPNEIQMKSKWNL